MNEKRDTIKQVEVIVSLREYIADTIVNWAKYPATKVKEHRREAIDDLRYALETQRKLYGVREIIRGAERALDIAQYHEQDKSLDRKEVIK